MYSTGKFTILKLHVAPLGQGLISRAQEPTLLALPTAYIEGDIATEYKLSVDSRLRLLRPGFLKTK